MTRTIHLALAALLVTSPAAAAQTRATPGTIDGYVTTQGKTIPLGGAQVVVRNGLNDEIGTVLTEADGHFRIAVLPDGRYRVAVTLAGFEPTTVQASVTAGATTNVAVDLPIAAISQTVEVVGSAGIATGATIAPTDSLGGRDIEQYTGGGFQAALRLLASIIEVPGGLSIKGGRPSQAGVQMGAITLVDPTTGLSTMSLPDDAIDSVEVLPNPYAVEYGRFSSGLVVIQTRRAGDKWKTRLNNLDPTFRTARGTMFQIKGIGAFAPRLETGGPIVKDQLFLEQTAQFRYATTDVASRPEDELKTTRWFSSFTRVDWNISPRHSIVGTGGFSPSAETWATLGTFTPPNATADIHAHVNHGGVTERALWSDTVFSETTVQVHEAQTDVDPQGPLPMQLLPETTLGNFYNVQRRSTATYQIVETVSGTRTLGGGLHLYKAGFDVLYSRYNGTSASRPVLIERTDGSLARRLDFTGPSAQTVDSTDIALFVQDRFQPNARWFLEFGGRLDRDGVVETLNVTPRVGTAVLLNASGTSVLRGGFGLFFERTPSTVGAFEQFESALDTRYAADGQTPLGPPIPFVHRTAPNLETPRSRTWDIGIDQRINARPRVDRRPGARRRCRHAAAVEQRPQPVSRGRDRRSLLAWPGGRRQRLVREVDRARRSERADQLLRRRDVADRRRERVRAAVRRRAAPPARPRPGDADAELAAGRHFRLAQRHAVVGRERVPGFRRPAQRTVSLPGLRADRDRHRAPVQDLQAAAVDWRARLQCVRRLSADRRAGQHHLAVLRQVLQLGVPPAPPAVPFRALRCRPSRVSR